MNDALTRLGLIDDDDIVLDEAALALAMLDHEEIDDTPYRRLLASIASRLKLEGRGTRSARDRADALSAVVAAEFGFIGDRETYDDPANADLIRIIDRRRGLPVSLSILYVAAARRVGWAAEVLNVPGHVLVLVDGDATPVIVDPFRGGVEVDAHGLASLMASQADVSAAAVRRVAAMPNRSVLVRLLLNQATRAEAAGHGRRALTLYGRMTVIAPDHGHAWWERARLELIDSDVPSARSSLSAMLEVTREPEMRDRINTVLGRLVAP